MLDAWDAATQLMGVEADQQQTLRRTAPHQPTPNARNPNIRMLGAQSIKLTDWPERTIEHFVQTLNTAAVVAYLPDDGTGRHVFNFKTWTGECASL